PKCFFIKVFKKKKKDNWVQMSLQIFARIAVLLWLWFTKTAGDRNTFDCPMRQLALNYAYYLNDQLSAEQLQEIADALNGSPEKTPSNCTVDPREVLGAKTFKQLKKQRWPHSWDSYHSKRPHMQSNIEKAKQRVFSVPEERTVYVDVQHGNDINEGSIGRPMQTIHAALSKLRNSCTKADTKKIVLRKGKKKKIYINIYMYIYIYVY
ncbi:hypothetical protein RFI_18964, partial [Reticulomyxa filosa]